MSAPSLDFQRLIAAYNLVEAKIEPTYKFRLPNLDEELDIRDYKFKEACGSYFLMRKEDPEWRPRFNEWRFTFPYELEFHPAHFIWLQGCTPEIARQIRDIMP